MPIKDPNTLPWFGTINNWEQAIGPGYSNPYPDQNNKPISKGKASGTQLPWNLIRNDAANPVHNSYVNSPHWTPGMQATKDYCTANGCAFSFQLYYPQYDGACSWNTLKACAQKIAPFLTGYPVYVILGNECLNGSSGFSPISNPPFSDLGGKGSTGLDGLINCIKELRKIFGTNCLLGINEYNALDLSVGNPNWNMAPAIDVYKKCSDNGARMDWFGAEGYWMNNNYSGFSDPVDMLNKTCNQFGNATGTGIMYTEASLMSPAKGPPRYATQLECWQKLLGAMVANEYTIGFTGPWGGIRYTQAWNGDHGENARSQNFMYNDSGSAQPDPNKGSNIAVGGFTSTLTWLQGWVPTVAGLGGGSGGNPNPPQPESADGTVVQNDSSGQIVDSHSDVWTCMGGVVKKNSSNAGYSANVTRIEYHSHVVWQTNNSGGWWKWTGSDWAAGTNPNPNPPDTGILPKGTYTVPANTQIIVP